MDEVILKAETLPIMNRLRAEAVVARLWPCEDGQPHGLRTELIDALEQDFGTVSYQVASHEQRLTALEEQLQTVLETIVAIDQLLSAPKVTD